MRILVIYTGGVPQFSGKTNSYITKTLQNFLELQLVANLDVIVLHDIAGAEITYDVCTALAQRIHTQYQKYDGFVIIHGLDNVLYTSNLLAFLFSSLGKPIIFTGCTLPDELDRSEQLSVHEQVMYREMGLRTNLVTALQLASLDCAGVLLAYSPHIVRAVRALPAVNDEMPYLRSWQEPNMAEVQFGVRLASTTPPRQLELPQLYGSFSTDVYVVEPRPSLILPGDLEQTYRAVVIRGWRESVLPSNVRWPKHIPIVVQIHHQAIPSILPDNVITIQGTWPVILTKTMAVAGQTKSLAEFKQRFLDNRFHEFN